MYAGCADHHARPGYRLILADVCRKRVGHAKVREGDVPVRQQDVVRLDVAVNDARRVRVRQRIDHFSEQSRGFRNRQPSLALKPGAQRFAVDERHHVERQAVGGAGVEERQDVRMPKMGGGTDLGEEAVRRRPRPPGRDSGP